MDCWLVQKVLRDARLHFVRRLPFATLKSFFFTDATGGYPGGVWDCSLLYLTARPATKAPVAALSLTGSSCTAAPQCVLRTYHNLCCTWYDAYVPAWHSTDCDVAFQTEQVKSRCDPCLHEDREARQTALVLFTPAMASDHTQSRGHAMTLQAGPHEDPPTRGRRDEVPGSDQPQPSHVLYGTSGVLSSGAYALQSPLQLAKVVPADKRSPEDTRWRSSRGTALRKKSSPAAQRTGGHRRVTTRKTTGGYPATQGTDPETELTGQWCCAVVSSGLHRSWWTLVTRTEWEAPTLRAALSASTRPKWAPHRWLSASPTTRKRVCVPSEYLWLRAS